MNNVALEQGLFDAIFTIAKETKSDLKVYTALPPLSVKGLFVVMGEVRELPMPTKTHVKRKFFTSINVWGDYNQRFDVSNIAQGIFSQCYEIKIGEQVAKLRKAASTKRIINDTSVENTSLWRGLLELEFDII